MIHPVIGHQILFLKHRSDTNGLCQMGEIQDVYKKEIPTVEQQKPECKKKKSVDSKLTSILFMYLLSDNTTLRSCLRCLNSLHGAKTYIPRFEVQMSKCPRFKILTSEREFCEKIILAVLASSSIHAFLKSRSGDIDDIRRILGGMAMDLGGGDLT